MRTLVLALLLAAGLGAAQASQRTAGERVLDLVNAARATPRYCGGRYFNAAGPLRWNDALAEAALEHADDMARHYFFGHAGSDGSDPAARVERVGYRYRMMGENIAAGDMGPDEAVAGWIHSPGHCANLMNPAFTEMGAAYAFNPRSEYRVYWAQSFGTRR